MLHNEKSLFEQVILRASEYLGISEAIIEKDYYVTLFLRELVKTAPNIIFKGGTSLSKCHHLIKRFSEDIDLSIETDGKPTESERRQLRDNILSVIGKLNLSLENPEEIKSRMDFNAYTVNFPSVIATSFLKNTLIVETAVFLKAYPIVTMTASSFIYDYLSENGFGDFIRKYNLEPFSVNVQSAERTFIDKIYAIADYYLTDNLYEHSRHIYDIYKLYSAVKINDELKVLAEQVVYDRKQDRNCPSAKEGVNIKQILKEIIDTNAYKKDYDEVTANLLFEKVPYDTAIKALSDIIQSRLFD